MTTQKFQHFLRVIHMPLHTKWQGFKTLKNMKGIGRRHAWPQIIHAFGAEPRGKGGRAKFFIEIDAIHRIMRAGNRWKFVVTTPVKITSINSDTANGNAVAAHPFGQRMNNDIGTKIDWL